MVLYFPLMTDPQTCACGSSAGGENHHFIPRTDAAIPPLTARPLCGGVTLRFGTSDAVTPILTAPVTASTLWTDTPVRKSDHRPSP